MKSIISLLAGKSQKTSRLFVLFLTLFGLSGCDIWDSFFKDTTKVTLKSEHAVLHEGQTSKVDATLTKGPPNNAPIPNHNSIQFSPAVSGAGAFNVTTKATDSSGVASVVFTAKKVDVDTRVDITATSRNGSGSQDTKIITVKPAIFFGDFGGDDSDTAIDNNDIKITPSVTELSSNKYQFSYVVTNSTSQTIDHMVVSFSVPMDSVTTTDGFVTSRQNKTHNNVSLITLDELTITAICSDCDTGGTANFVVFDGPLPTPSAPTPPDMVNKNLIGPEAPD
jgi:hypothetical protein